MAMKLKRQALAYNFAAGIVGPLRQSLGQRHFEGSERKLIVCQAIESILLLQFLSQRGCLDLRVARELASEFDSLGLVEIHDFFGSWGWMFPANAPGQVEL